MASLVANFPSDLRPVIEICTQLAAASEQSAESVLNCLDQMSVYSESIECVSSGHVQSRGPDKLVSTVHRCPNDLCRDIVIPAGAVAETDGRTLKWSIEFNGWKYLLAEFDRLQNQVSVP